MVLSGVELNVAITNHIKAGTTENIEEAKKLIEGMSKFDKEQSSYRISKLLTRAGSLAAKDVNALRIKKQMLDESIANGPKFYKEYNTNKAE